MFEFSRELKRLFCSDGPKDGLTGGHAPLLELLDLNLLRSEAKAADVAAGRISAKDPAQRALEAARVWMEVARRTGDALALRKAASVAEGAAHAFEREGRTRGWGQARVEQALVAMNGAEIFGDEGLNAAAEYALNDVLQKAPGSAAAILAEALLVSLHAHPELRNGDANAALAAAARFDAPIAAVEALMRSRSIAKVRVLGLCCDRGELLLAAGSRLRDAELLAKALDAFNALGERVDATYEPIVWARIRELKGAAQVALGETRGELDLIADGVAAFADAIDMIGPDHSPMDWARLQHGLALALRALGDASDSEKAFDQSLHCFDRTLWMLRNQPAILLRSAASSNRAATLARRAELTGDVAAIREAVDALKAELSALSPAKDPVVWAVCQVNLARLYETRMALRGASPGEVAAAALALTSALDVFGEHGLRSLADEASRALERLSARNRSDA
jgi:tetratricopeptide (TPR) repeat protein